ncbi:serine/threonine-protein kinase [Corallococcus sp. CA054B]|uniref:serine/threonine protein kinase n=1 Tax=Corallococcus sp. CA054B TaxID=2316734 RepID=UPI001315982A|nr:serine/threonine-protein kinase [Corallococcus sp. CA054B]
MRLSPPSPSIAPGTVVGGYTLERKLGAGGYGTVYLAREREGGLFALKFLPVEEAGRWGEREVSILLRLQHLAHPHVVRLLSHTLWPVAEEPEFLVIVMEYVRGAALDKWAREVNPTARAVASVVLDVARALAAVHGEGVVHRDVKGSNVLVRAEDGRAVLADFGVGGYPGAPGITRHPFLPGTPEYRAPEAWRHRRDDASGRYVAGPADDLWALGVTLYWLLTDRYPFEAPDDTAQVEAILSRMPPAPREVNPRVPEVLSRVCMRLLEKRPEARFADAGALATELAEALAGADAAWDVPLCDFYTVHTATTKGRAANLLAWAKAPHQPPRRGPRPKRAAAETPPRAGVGVVDGAEARQEAPEPAEFGAAPPEGMMPSDAAPGVLAPVPSSKVTTLTADAAELHQRVPSARRGLRVAAGLVLVVAAVFVAWGTPWQVPMTAARHNPSVAAAPVQEVAPSNLPLEADQATAPPLSAASTVVAAASVVASPEDSAPMKKPQPPTASMRKQLQKAGCVAGASLALACTSGAQVRPPPDPEDCPQAALTAMEELKIDIGDERTGNFTGYTGEPRVITVRGGSGSIRVVGGYNEQFPGNTVLSCRITLGERVFGRCNWARTKAGKTYPVCFELHHRDGKLGVERKDDANADSARIFNVFDVEPVRRFE